MSASQLQDFEQLWVVYPRKTAKSDARRAFAKAIVKTTIAAMIAAIVWQKQTEQWQRGVIPHLATWLNKERWEDEPSKTPTLKAKTINTMKAIYEDEDDDE